MRVELAVVDVYIYIYMRACNIVKGEFSKLARPLVEIHLRWGCIYNHRYADALQPVNGRVAFERERVMHTALMEREPLVYLCGREVVAAGFWLRRKMN